MTNYNETPEAARYASALITQGNETRNRAISAIALEVGVIRQMTTHDLYDQPMPSREELELLAMQEIYAARGINPRLQ